MNREYARFVLLVARQDLNIRVRTGRWRWMLGGWFAVVGLFTLLCDLALHESKPRGIPLFGVLMLFVLALAMMVSPVLTAQSVNGDRERGTLAPLQVTAFTPGQIALGKLLAGWAVGLVALALALPFVGWSMLRGGVGLARAAVVVTVVALMIGVVCAVSQALSALLARSTTSALVSYLAMFALTIGTVISYALVSSLVDSGVRSSTWVLLAPNPFVVLADSAPRLPHDPQDRYYNNDPLGSLANEVRDLRDTPRYDYEYRGAYDEPVVVEDRWLDSRAVWPYGLAFDLMLGAGALTITVRRLRTPYRGVPKGVRVA